MELLPTRKESTILARSFAEATVENKRSLIKFFDFTEEEREMFSRPDLNAERFLISIPTF